ncbi:cardiolipin synthase A [Brevibacterium sp. 5221]|uniref:Cardiolipin synthase A n=1 Tax=Brevibacterium rongguiense TaxID=2695267 RepID=A0A6N9H803_9MICO|nr:phospholipase D-like domain-containing protein [Brevibacterium rongguiense]MYM20150.1 cardiolipin synthase A [Brevibacterium rongguiense]
MTWPAVLTTSWIVFEYIVKIIAVGVVPDNRKPGSAAGWLMLILFLPIVGVPLFLILGSPYIDRPRERIQREANKLLAKGTKQVPDYPAALEPSAALASVIGLDRRLTYLPMVDGDNEGVLMSDAESLARMVRLVEGAQRYVHCEIYIMAWDETTNAFFEACAAAVRRGVRVRVMMDHLGSRKYPGFKHLGRRLSEAGIEWHLMLPFLPLKGKIRRPDLRNHRKLLVVDGKYGVMGSQNMITPDYESKKNDEVGRRWHDVTVELTGQIVMELEAVFETDWYTESGEELDYLVYRMPDEPAPPLGGKTNAFQLVPSGPGFHTAPNLRLYTSLIGMATKHVRMVSPYFVPSESFLDAITTACYRGVRFDLYLCSSDQYVVGRAQESYYEALLEAGVIIHEYPKPELLHTKCFTIDGTYAVMGSANMDMRSFGLNYEISLLSARGNMLDQIEQVIDSYDAKSSLLDLEQWRRRPWTRKYMESVCRLSSALM